MRKVTKILLVVATLFPAPFVRAQYTVVQGWVSVSRTLAGHVEIGFDKLPAENVTVDVCSADWQTVIESTKTDHNGFFSLMNSRPGQLYYVRLSAYGVNPYQLRVQIKKRGARELKIHLNVAA